MRQDEKMLLTDLVSMKLIIPVDVLASLFETPRYI